MCNVIEMQLTFTAYYTWKTGDTLLTSRSTSSRRKCNSTSRDLCADSSTSSFRRCSVAAVVLSSSTCAAVVVPLPPPPSVKSVTGDERDSHEVVGCHGNRADAGTGDNCCGCCCCCRRCLWTGSGDLGGKTPSPSAANVCSRRSVLLLPNRKTKRN